MALNADKRNPAVSTQPADVQYAEMTVTYRRVSGGEVVRATDAGYDAACAEYDAHREQMRELARQNTRRLTGRDRV